MTAIKSDSRHQVQKKKVLAIKIQLVDQILLPAPWQVAFHTGIFNGNSLNIPMTN